MIPGGKLDSAPLLAFSFLSTVEWRSPRRNVLLEGSEPSTLAVLRLLEPHLPEPVIRKGRGSPLQLPDGDIGALILEEVSDLSGDEQARLLAWIDDRCQTQIVSTTARPLFERVARGLFDASLYYRLNVIVVDLERRQDFGFQAGGVIAPGLGGEAVAGQLS
jgi:Sigma-54 interaction domain